MPAITIIFDDPAIVSHTLNNPPYLFAVESRLSDNFRITRDIRRIRALRIKRGVHSGNTEKLSRNGRRCCINTRITPRPSTVFRLSDITSDKRIFTGLGFFILSHCYYLNRISACFSYTANCTIFDEKCLEAGIKNIVFLSTIFSEQRF